MKRFLYLTLTATVLWASSCSEEPIVPTQEASPRFRVTAMEYSQAIENAASLAQSYTAYNGALRMVDVEDGYLKTIGGYTDYASAIDSIPYIGNLGEHDYYFYNIHEVSDDLSHPVLRQVSGISRMNFPSLEYGMSSEEIAAQRLSLHATAWANYALRLKQNDSYDPVYNQKGLSYLILSKDPICNLYHPPYDLYMCHQHQDVQMDTEGCDIQLDLLTSALRLEITIPSAADNTSPNHRFLNEIEEVVAVVANLPQTLCFVDGKPMPSDSLYASVNHLLGRYDQNSTKQSIAGLDGLYGGGFALTPMVSGNDIVFTGETTCFPQAEGDTPPELRVYLKYRGTGFIFVLYPEMSNTMKAGVRNVVSLTIQSEYSSYSYPSDVAKYMVDRTLPLAAVENSEKAFMVDIYNKENTILTGRVCSEYVKDCDAENPCLVYYVVKDDLADKFADTYSEGIVFKQSVLFGRTSYLATGTFSSAAVYTPFPSTNPYAIEGKYINLSVTPGDTALSLQSSDSVTLVPYRSYRPYILSDSRGSGILREISVYKPVKIGTQIWTSSSMSTIKTIAATNLAGVLGKDTVSRNLYWKEHASSIAMYCGRNDKDSLRTVEGYLYNYLAAKDSMYMAHTKCPSVSDWNVLIDYSSPLALLDKSAGGNNLSGFSARLSGCRLSDGRFNEMDNIFYMWLLNSDNSFAAGGVSTSSFTLVSGAVKQSDACAIRFLMDK